MHKHIFVTLPCRDLARTKAFFETLGYAFDPQFTSDQSAGLVLGENLRAMLMAESFMKTFTGKPLIDARTSTAGWVCLTCDSREEVDAMVAKARAAGGHVPGDPQDHGFMYGHGFEDPDGHHWELVHLSGMPPPT